MIRPRWYDMPIAWFAVQAAEYALFAFVIGWLVPDTWPVAVAWTIAIVGLVLITIANYRLIRRLRRREDEAPPSGI